MTDCVYIGWRLQTPCPAECGRGMYSIKVPNIIRKESGNGKPCPSPIYEPCPNSRPCVPVDCKYDGWIEEQVCPPCGQGYKILRPKIITREKYGGRPCPERKVEACVKNRPCPTPIDCEYDGWIEKVPCQTCGPAEGRSMYRIPKVITEPAYGGYPCPRGQFVRCKDRPPCPKN